MWWRDHGNDTVDSFFLCLSDVHEIVMSIQRHDAWIRKNVFAFLFSLDRSTLLKMSNSFLIYDQIIMKIIFSSYNSDKKNHFRTCLLYQWQQININWKRNKNMRYMPDEFHLSFRRPSLKNNLYRNDWRCASRVTFIASEYTNTFHWRDACLLHQQTEKRRKNHRKKRKRKNGHIRIVEIFFYD